MAQLYPTKNIWPRTVSGIRPTATAVCRAASCIISGESVELNRHMHPDQTCLFCTIPAERIIGSNDLAYAIRDGFPVTPLHTLVIPKRHVEDFFGLSQDEMQACHDLLKQFRFSILAEDAKVEGFNIGMNAGSVAGQTIFHCHIHLIARRTGDVENPRGGVRHMIPGKGFY